MLQYSTYLACCRSVTSPAARSRRREAHRPSLHQASQVLARRQKSRRAALRPSFKPPACKLSVPCRCRYARAIRVRTAHCFWLADCTSSVCPSSTSLAPSCDLPKNLERSIDSVILVSRRYCRLRPTSSCSAPGRCGTGSPDHRYCGVSRNGLTCQA